jgi:hypothetical protein
MIQFKKIFAALIIIVVSTNALANNNCNTKTHTVMENGKIIKETVVKKCDETVDLDQKSFVELLLTDPAYENAMILIGIFLLENVL